MYLWVLGVSEPTHCSPWVLGQGWKPLKWSTKMSLTGSWALRSSGWKFQLTDSCWLTGLLLEKVHFSRWLVPFTATTSLAVWTSTAAASHSAAGRTGGNHCLQWAHHRSLSPSVPWEPHLRWQRITWVSHKHFKGGGPADLFTRIPSNRTKAHSKIAISHARTSLYTLPAQHHAHHGGTALTDISRASFRRFMAQLGNSRKVSQAEEF